MKLLMLCLSCRLSHYICNHINSRTIFDNNSAVVGFRTYEVICHKNVFRSLAINWVFKQRNRTLIVTVNHWRFKLIFTTDVIQQLNEI